MSTLDEPKGDIVHWDEPQSDPVAEVGHPVTYTMPERAGPVCPQLAAGWQVTQSGLQAYGEEIERFKKALTTTWQAKTSARGSTSLDEPDCRAASRFLLTGLRPPKWKVVLRVAATAFIMVAGEMVAQDFAQPQDLLMLVGGGALAVVVLILQEALLR